MARARATLRDVARRVGVHESTVSRVLNPATRHMFTPDVVRRVTEAAGALGYRPNPIAYSLKTNRTLTVGVLIPDLTNPLFPPVLRGIEDTLGAADYTAIIANTDNLEARAATALDRMKGRRVDGLILATARREDAVISDIIAEEVPCVLINRTTDAGKIPAVVTDDVRGIGLTVEHLVGLGHRRIAHIAGPQTVSTGHDRYLGFFEAMRRHRLDTDLVIFCDAFSEPAGAAAMAELMTGDDGFTAVIAANDMLAIGCYDALARQGRVCPRQVSVTGYNDMPFVDKLSPPLTTVRIPQYAIGAEAARMLLALIKTPAEPPPSVLLCPTLVIRSSTAPPGG
jgi:LacI family transcriptional regulator, galactose operon repressor